MNTTRLLPLLLIIGIAATFLAPPAALADDNYPKVAPPRFEHPTSDEVADIVAEIIDERDVNGDGKVDLREFKLHRALADDDPRRLDPDGERLLHPMFLTGAEEFALADLNNNGEVGERELYDYGVRMRIRSHSARWVAEYFDKDANDDNRIGPREFTGSTGLFNVIDANDSDRINRFELFQWGVDVIHRDLVGLTYFDAPPREKIVQALNTLMRDLDDNNDGALGPREFPRQADDPGVPDEIRKTRPWYLTRAETFALADTDDNGRISRQELGEWMFLVKMREHAREWLEGFMRRHDDNDDGRIELDEWPATHYRFRKADADDSRTVTIPELWRRAMNLLEVDQEIRRSIRDDNE